MESVKIGSAVAPGDTLRALPSSGVVRVGTGVTRDGPNLSATRAGELQCARDGTLWVLGGTSRYTPTVGDVVVGTVVQRFPETYAVDIGAPALATLPALAFDAASRRAAPRLIAGDVVLARVTEAFRDVAPELSCVEEIRAGSAGTLGAVQGGLGPLVGGHEFCVDTRDARVLVAMPPFLAVLGSAARFELAVGANGRVWVDAVDPRVAVLVSTACRIGVRKSPEEATELVRALLGARGGWKRSND